MQLDRVHKWVALQKDNVGWKKEVV